MGVMRTFVLLIVVTVVALEVGELFAAMVAAGDLFQSEAMSTSVVSFCSAVLLPPLPACLGGMAPSSPRLTEHGGADSDIFSTRCLSWRRTCMGDPCWPGPGCALAPVLQVAGVSVRQPRRRPGTGPQGTQQPRRCGNPHRPLQRRRAPIRALHHQTAAASRRTSARPALHPAIAGDLIDHLGGVDLRMSAFPLRSARGVRCFPVRWAPEAAMWSPATVLWARKRQAGRHAWTLGGLRCMFHSFGRHAALSDGQRWQRLAELSFGAFKNKLAAGRLAALSGGQCSHAFRALPRAEAQMSSEHRLSYQTSFNCQAVFLFICRHGSGETVTGARVDRQSQLKPVLRFGISCCGSILLSPVKPPSYLRLKTTILEDTGRSDSRGERRLCYRSARTRTLDASIVATSRGSPDPDGPSALDGSITHVSRSKFAVPFTCMCFVIWEFVFPHRCNVL